MRVKQTLLLMGACVSLVGMMGCASNEGQGGATDQNAALTGAGESQPEPMGSPSFRPGMNPRDPRDPLFNTRNQPMGYPPAVTK